MITVYLGLSFSGPILPYPAATSTEELFLDYPALVQYLEKFYALSRSPANRDALRIEQYRQVLQQHLEDGDRPLPFYAAAFRADKIATAEELLSRRDELLENGYQLHHPTNGDVPERIAVLHELEALLLEPERDLPLLPGLADRLNRLLAALKSRNHPTHRIVVNEPANLLPGSVRRLLEGLREAGDQISYQSELPQIKGDLDLHRWQRRLLASLDDDTDTEAFELRGDGSLVLLRAERETHLAAYLARTVRDNPTWRPGVLMTVRNQTLDNALIMEGLPSMGIPSTSLARPSLQVLKLVTAFLWDPVEVERIMEFVSLVNKPLERRLGQRLAVHLADTPGLFGNRWNFTVEEAFREMEQRRYPAGRLRRAREQYDFWFRRRRFPRDGRVPKSEVRSLFVFLRNWALEAYEDDKDQSGLLVLSAQSERATELLDAQPEADLSYLEVERLVRTIYQPAPTQFRQPEQGALRVCFHPAAVTRIAPDSQDPLDRLVWWDFIETDPTYFFSRYYPPELDYLRGQGCHLVTPDQRNRLRHWQNLQPVLNGEKQLVLCVPQRVDGSEMESHSLMGDLEAAFSGDSLERITVRIDEGGRPEDLFSELTLPHFEPISIRQLSPPVPLVHLSRPEAMTAREEETPSSIDDLLYYPHKWVFRHQLRLKSTPILSIANENRLRGNLSHLFVDELLQEITRADEQWNKEQVERWLDENATRLLRQQGAVLLEYGQEPERVQFLITMKKSAWTLINYIQQNGWSIKGSEEKVGGELKPMGGQAVQGRADLVLERERNGIRECAVVDLKWRGKTVFRNLLRNGSDIQLSLYAEFLRQQGSDRVHTAYYILRDALMICRNELAFEGADTVPADDDFVAVQKETLSKIRQTFDWRWEQFADGRIEVRCRETVPFLEDLYQDLSHDSLLEMKDDTSPFDDYKSLIGLIR
ncbi:PD-(D/E)XK nuclease family protein [Lewinella sp. IMCC34191]|uniref:PD-(D/E)XK nuclease family protein n=1 Tax=Lewinella sp. IMCC34191 TaxID=2259172 RepID=UPI000E26B05C|nr:PD-(D/E)XK nuclease family protein [Lewinella sp. IMCC34191]